MGEPTVGPGVVDPIALVVTPGIVPHPARIAVDVRALVSPLRVLAPARWLRSTHGDRGRAGRARPGLRPDGRTRGSRCGPARRTRGKSRRRSCAGVSVFVMAFVMVSLPVVRLPVLRGGVPGTEGGGERQR